MSNASKNGNSEEKNIRTVQNISSSVKDVSKCIRKHEISEALKFKSTFRWLQLYFSMIMKHKESKIVVQQGITQFLQFLEPKTGLAFSSDAMLEF